MKRIFEFLVVLIVAICINVKDVMSQFSFSGGGGFANSYSAPPLGTSLNFQSLKDWHHLSSGSSSFGNNNDWSNTDHAAQSSSLKRNTGFMNLAPKQMKDEYYSIFPEFNKNKAEIATEHLLKLSTFKTTEYQTKFPVTTATPTTTQNSVTKPLSFGAKAHVFLLKLVGKYEV